MSRRRSRSRPPRCSRRSASRRSPPSDDARRWAGVLGGEVDEDGDWHMVLVDGAPRTGVQLAVEDFAEAHEHVTALGARVLKPASGATAGDDFQVYADPAGHPFCLCWLVRKAPPA
ncbi:VOC family protein [Amycolatopsis sp. cmx-4-83]|uniref:VOC family protein n=1 Tax=Amycolatopsis sp. cmx-4-83 TaxID=2790940 RepID=UPI00397E256F